MVVMTDDAGGGDRVTKRDAAVDKPWALVEPLWRTAASVCVLRFTTKL
jgi:hypothetical protein